MVNKFLEGHIQSYRGVLVLQNMCTSSANKVKIQENTLVNQLARQTFKCISAQHIRVHATVVIISMVLQ